MDKIIVIGGGGHAKVVISILKKLNKYEIIGYTDNKNNGEILGVHYLGNDDILRGLLKKDVNKAVIGIGNINSCKNILEISNKLTKLGYSFPPIISPDSILNEGTSVGKGAAVMDGVVINTGTVIGDFSIINTNSSIDHDCSIGNFVHIAPGSVLCGRVEIGDNTFIGTGVTIIQNIHIEPHCMIGAGAVVNKDITHKGKYIGNPLRRIL